MELVYKSEFIKDPAINLVEDLRKTIFWLEGIDDTRDYIIKMGGVLYSVLNSQKLSGSPYIFRGIEYIEDNNIDAGHYCIYKKDRTIPIKLKPIKTLDDWFANLPLIYKLDLYNSYSGVITKHLK